MVLPVHAGVCNMIHLPCGPLLEAAKTHLGNGCIQGKPEKKCGTGLFPTRTTVLARCTPHLYLRVTRFTPGMHKIGIHLVRSYTLLFHVRYYSLDQVRRQFGP